jgi:hypothetical protein
MSRPEVTGKKQQQIDNIPFDERLFTSRQAREILCEGKTKFFEESLPQLDFFLDGNKHKITGRSIRELKERRMAAGRVRRPTPQVRKFKAHIEPRAE